LHGILITGMLFFVGLCLHFFVADSRLFFQLLAGMTTSCFLFVWSSILCAHVQFIKEKKRNTTQRYKDLALLVFFTSIAFSLLFESTTRFIPFLLVIWFVFLNFVYKRISNRNIS
ncbi:amino acid permease, partial [Enterococcus faecium]|nr:amino acid permease [Enterococcus faecium]